MHESINSSASEETIKFTAETSNTSTCRSEGFSTKVLHLLCEPNVFYIAQLQWLGYIWLAGLSNHANK